TDADTAQVQQQSLRVEKSASSFLMAVGMISTDGSMTQEDIADYVGANIKDPVSGTHGVAVCSSARLFLPDEDQGGSWLWCSYPQELLRNGRRKFWIR
ncbi:hypothetical protein ATT74_25940, partial [Salmonella enterica subsp. enterica serovar Panama]|nr:hypothetical protein [Salmonella enterica subsp. enterica serovar Panama]ECX3498022.1 hypothetical protein [Salmonella enterica subsp. enterica serovar Panama]ECX6035553.1 hypothetical protein [Salmonella enterica subsp. enterica serovar Panama]EGU5384002.1 hypothetical protein [Salmonella enterica]EGX1719713.1 hypothetical protein [Salmonella enterica subsp. enterica serovar Panama]